MFLKMKIKQKVCIQKIATFSALKIMAGQRSMTVETAFVTAKKLH